MINKALTKNVIVRTVWKPTSITMFTSTIYSCLNTFSSQLMSPKISYLQWTLIITSSLGSEKCACYNENIVISGSGLQKQYNTEDI